MNKQKKFSAEFTDALMVDTMNQKIKSLVTMSMREYSFVLLYIKDKRKEKLAGK